MPTPVRRALAHLPPGTVSLRSVGRDDPPDVLYVLADDGGVRVDPGAREFREDRPVLVGRNEPEVDVYLAPGDAEVARVQAMLTFDGREWRLTNQGPLSLRIPAREVRAGETVSLAYGWVTAHLETRSGRQYVLEIRVTRTDEPSPPPRVGGEHEGQLATVDVRRRRRDLSPVDRLVLVALARRYLAFEPQAAPLPWAQVAEELAEVAPDRAWSRRTVENRVRRVREELARDGVVGLRAEELEPPIGNQINQNLIMALMVSRTIGPADLDELGFRTDA